jgi:hypothetical protein
MHMSVLALDLMEHMGGKGNEMRGKHENGF